MKKNRDFLTVLIKTIQMGQIEIRSVLDTTMCSSLRNTLEKQLHEYDSMETEAYTIALQRGWDLPEPDPIKAFLKDKTTRIQLNRHKTDSGIADILIQRNTKAMILGLRHLHQFDTEDHQIKILSQKLLDCETAHIRQMQNYL